MTDKEKLFEAVYECCPDLQEIERAIIDRKSYFPVGEYDRIRSYVMKQARIEHLLRTAAARGNNIVIDVWGNVMEIIGENEHGINLNTPICRIDLTKSLENQEEATLIQLAKVIL